MNLVATTSNVAISNPNLDAVQVNEVGVVAVNQTFNITAALVDSESKQQLVDLNWMSSNWVISVSLHTLPRCNPDGVLVTGAPLSTVVDPNNNRITATNLAITAVGMYVIEIRLQNSNPLVDITVISNATLVKENSSKMCSLV